MNSDFEAANPLTFTDQFDIGNQPRNSNFARCRYTSFEHERTSERVSERVHTRFSHPIFAFNLATNFNFSLNIYINVYYRIWDLRKFQHFVFLLDFLFPIHASTASPSSPILLLLPSNIGTPIRIHTRTIFVMLQLG